MRKPLGRLLQLHLEHADAVIRGRMPGVGLQSRSVELLGLVQIPRKLQPHRLGAARIRVRGRGLGH